VTIHEPDKWPEVDPTSDVETVDPGG